MAPMYSKFKKCIFGLIYFWCWVLLLFSNVCLFAFSSSPPSPFFFSILNQISVKSLLIRFLCSFSMIGPGNNFYYNSILRWWEYTRTLRLYTGLAVFSKGIKQKSVAVTAEHISSFLCDLNLILVCASVN